MKRILIIFLLIGVAIAVVGLLTPKANAIPAFARKYQTSCVTCHIAYPKLSAFGDAFRRNGFQFPDGTDEEYIKEEPVSLGNEAYKEMFPRMIWPGQIPGTIPLAIRLEGGYHITPNDEITNDFHFPNSMVMIMGGTLGENLSFYSDVHLFEHAKIGFENRAYAQFSELFERWLPSSALNIKVGQFTIAANPFSMHRDMIILTPLSLATYSPALGASLAAGHHGSTGSLEMTQRGVEIDGVLKHRLTYALGIVNGNGIGEADSTIKYDNNSSKDAYVRLAYKIDRKSTRLNSSHIPLPRMPSSA